MGLAP